MPTYQETNPHFKPLHQPSPSPPSPGVTLPSPRAGPLQRQDQQNQPPGSRGIRHQGERSKPQRPRGGALQVDGALPNSQDKDQLQSQRKQPAPHQGQDQHGSGGYSTLWLFPHHPDDRHRVHDPQDNGRYHSPWIRIPPHQMQDHRPHPLTQPHYQDEHSKQPDNAQITSPKHHEQDHHPLHPRDPSSVPSVQDDQLHKSSGLRTLAPQKTKAITWLGAAFCAIFWIIIFLGGLIVLIVYLIYRPRNPRFEVSSATLNVAYVDSGSLLNADISLLANFTNPNKKVTVDFTHMIIDLYYGNTLIATQYIESFSTARMQSMFANIHMISSQVRLPLGESVHLQDQISKNQILFEVKGVFQVRSNLGSLFRYSYRLYGHCTIMVTAPPSGVLRATRCRTKR